MKNELNSYLEAIKVDYVNGKWVTGDEIHDNIRNESIVRFCLGLRIEEGSSYIKVISGNSVHSFIMKKDAIKNGKQFLKGDILKAATWRAPALNQARGNIFGEYHVSWTGADYLR